MKTRAYRVSCAIMENATDPSWEGDVIVYVRDIDRAHEVARRVCEGFPTFKWGRWVATRGISLAEDKIPLSIENRAPALDTEGATVRSSWRDLTSICADLSVRLKNSDFSIESEGMGVLLVHRLREDKETRTIPEILGDSLWRIGVVAMKGSNEGYYVQVLAFSNVTRDSDPLRKALEIYTVKLLSTAEEAADLASFLQDCFDGA